MPDIRELFDNPEEAFRTMWAGIQSHMHTMMISSVSEDSDGKTLKAIPAVKQRVVDKTGTQTTYEDYAQLLDVPPHFPGGAGATLTHGIRANDEVAVLFNGRAHDAWFQQGAGAQPMSERMHSLSDGVAFPGLRSMPRELKQISTDAMHLRDDAKHAVHEMKPGVGNRSFHADPSTPPASADFDPLSQAEKFVDHRSQSGIGAVGRAVDGGDTHDHGSHHGVGSWVQSFSGKHKVLAGLAGALLSAFDGDHKVNADQSGVQVTSKKAVSISAPPGMLSLAGLAAGSVGGAALGAGAAASNVGPLSGDLAGQLPSPQVIGLHVDFSQYPAAANDAAAAAAGVLVGGLYRSTAFVAAGTVSSSGGSGGSGGSGSSSTTLPPSGLSVLVVRMA